MRINTNISSLQAQRQLSLTTRAFARALERLSSGRRINRAGDDASGLGQATALESQIRGLRQNIQNVNQAFGFLQTADGVLATQTELVQRMRELSVQAATGTISSTDRAYLNEEFQTLYAEYNRNVEETNFNGVNLLDGSLTDLSIQVGTQKGQAISFGLGDSRAAAIFKEERGSGSFNFSTTLSGAGGTTLSKIVDLNGDGKQDIIQKNSSSYNIHLNQGDGNFTVSKTFSFTGSQTDSNDILTGDFNGDGNVDIALTASGLAASNLYLGNGQGGLSSGTVFEANDILQGVAADFNEDGIDDIVSLSFGIGTVGLQLGQSSGTMGARVDTGVNPGLDINYLLNRLNGSSIMATGDYNGDGHQDIAILDTSNDRILLGLGNGDGTFTSQVAAAGIGVGGSQDGIASGDINDDGLDDLVFQTDLGDSTTAYLGTSSGQMTLSSQTNCFLYNTRLVDLDGDGNLDYVGSGDTQYMGRGDGSFEATNYGMIYNDLGDLNGDGFVDFINPSLGVYIQDTTYVDATPFMDISDQSSASRVLQILDNALGSLMARRAGIGATMSRLESTGSVTSITAENLDQARSQIMDTDIADETAELIRQQILQQAQVSVSAQANLSLKLALRLLSPA